MIIKLRYIRYGYYKNTIFFSLSGPCRLKNYLKSRKNISDMNNEVQESLGKLLFVFYCLDFLTAMWVCSKVCCFIFLAFTHGECVYSKAY